MLDAASLPAAGDVDIVWQLPFRDAIFRGNGSVSMEQRKRAAQTKCPILQA